MGDKVAIGPKNSAVIGGANVIAEAAVTDSNSNMLYEKTFKYNYRLSSHLVGFSYAY